MEIAELDCETLAPNTLVKDVATYFVKNRHGCMPVVDNSGKVVGIVTSSDFVRLAVELLAQRA